MKIKMVRMDQEWSLNKRVFDRIRQYKRVGIIVTNNNCLNREQYGKKFK